MFFQAIFTIEKIIIRSRHGFDLQNNVEVTFQWMHCFCYQISQYWFAKKSLYCVCNAKRFAIAILFFLLFLIPSAVFWRTAISFLTNVLRLVTTEVCDQDLTHSLDTPKNVSVKFIPRVVICDMRGLWHGLFTVTRRELDCNF